MKGHKVAELSILFISFVDCSPKMLERHETYIYFIVTFLNNYQISITLYKLKIIYIKIKQIESVYKINLRF